MIKNNVLDFTLADWQQQFNALGFKSSAAARLIKWVYQFQLTDFAKMHDLSLPLRRYLQENYQVLPPILAEELIATDGTRKWLMRLNDGNVIETVFIPEGNRGTLCVSSQVGCAVRCAFCATGALGFTRNLTTAEIIGQLWLANKRLVPAGVHSAAITNVVFMGMGEPLLNYTNVLKAANLMLCDYAYGLSKYRVTVSTCGVVPQLIQLRQDSELSLAVSLHAPSDELRDQLVPMNRKYPLKELLAVTDHYFNDPRRAVTIEYIMIQGVNDSLEQARQLAKLLAHGHYKINLIPENRVQHSVLRASARSQIDQFRQVLLDAGFNTITRKSRGAEIAAACGQLAAARQEVK